MGGRIQRLVKRNTTIPGLFDLNTCFRSPCCLSAQKSHDDLSQVVEPSREEEGEKEGIVKVRDVITDQNPGYGTLDKSSALPSWSELNSSRATTTRGVEVRNFDESPPTPDPEVVIASDTGDDITEISRDPTEMSCDDGTEVSRHDSPTPAYSLAHGDRGRGMPPDRSLNDGDATDRFDYSHTISESGSEYPRTENEDPVSSSISTTHPSTLEHDPGLLNRVTAMKDGVMTKLHNTLERQSSRHQREGNHQEEEIDDDTSDPISGPIAAVNPGNVEVEIHNVVLGADKDDPAQPPPSSNIPNPEMETDSGIVANSSSDSFRKTRFKQESLKRNGREVNEVVKVTKVVSGNTNNLDSTAAIEDYTGMEGQFVLADASRDTFDTSEYTDEQGTDGEVKKKKKKGKFKLKFKKKKKKDDYDRQTVQSLPASMISKSESNMSEYSKYSAGAILAALDDLSDDDIAKE